MGKKESIAKIIGERRVFKDGKSSFGAATACTESCLWSFLADSFYTLHRRSMCDSLHDGKTSVDNKDNRTGETFLAAMGESSTIVPFMWFLCRLAFHDDPESGQEHPMSQEETRHPGGKYHTLPRNPRQSH